jgi:Cof subfamily protein (haloacid dehalogenase superfamily)
MIQLLFSDVDRTLLTHDYRLLPQVVNALAKVREASIRLVLATARSPIAVRPYARTLKAADLCICFNGAWIGNLESGEVHINHHLGRKVAEGVMALASSLDLVPMWFVGSAVYVLQLNAIVERQVRITGEKVIVTGALDGLPGEPHKILCVGDSAEKQARFQEIIRNTAGKATAARSHHHLLEVGPLAASKASAAAWVASRLGIDTGMCAAMGDSDNDVEMLRWSGIPMTVGNAATDIQNLCRFVGRTCDEAGAADAALWLVRTLSRTVATEA